MSDERTWEPGDPLPLPPADPAGVTPGAEPLAIEVDPDGGDAAPVFVESCPHCGHPLAAHAGETCTVMLGAYGTEGACPCPEVAA